MLESIVTSLVSGGPVWALVALLTGLLFWFLKRSLEVLDSRLAEIANRIGSGATEHRAEIRELGESHARAVEALTKRNEELTDRLLDRDRSRD